MTTKNTKTGLIEEPEIDMDAVYAELGLSPEDIAALKSMSGQGNVQSGDSLPVLKINLEMDPDKNGKEVRYGNFVVGQRKKDDVLEDVGIDCGAEPRIVIYAAPQQYNRYTKHKEGRCTSNFFFGYGDEVRGSTFGFSCRTKGDCPHRAEGIDDRCSAQWTVFCAVEVNGEWKQCVTYLFRKSNFIPFADYLKSLGSLLPYAVFTKLTKEKKKNGSVTYFVVTPVKDGVVPQIELKANIQIAHDTHKGIQAFESQRKQKQLAHKPEVVSNSPSGVTVVNDNSSEDIRF